MCSCMIYFIHRKIIIKYMCELTDDDPDVMQDNLDLANEEFSI